MHFFVDTVTDVVFDDTKVAFSENALYGGANSANSNTWSYLLNSLPK